MTQGGAVTLKFQHPLFFMTGEILSQKPFPDQFLNRKILWHNR